MTAPDRRVAAAELVTHAEAANETAPLTLQAPREVGEHVWSLVFATPDAAENAHDECVLPIAFATTPHETSVAVWDVPSPVAIDSRFTAKVGARCSAGCEMTGHAIEVRDQCGARVGGGTLGDTPWPGTSALRWTEIELTAPGAAGLAFWTIHVSREGLALAHSDASAAFSFKVEPRPEHRVTLRIVGEDTQAAIGGAEVRLGVYRAHDG